MTAATSNPSSYASPSSSSSSSSRRSPYTGGGSNGGGGGPSHLPSSAWSTNRPSHSPYSSPSLASKPLPLHPSEHNRPPPQQHQQHANYYSGSGSDDHIYQKAFALSRSTSVRRGQEGQDGSMKRYQLEDDGPMASRSSSQRPESGQLLSRNAFRDSVASDASFNTITGRSDRESIAFGGPSMSSRSPALHRRDSVDTVKTAEFDEGGRWGRAWADRAEDEESLYGGSEWGSGSGIGDGYDEDEDEDAGGGIMAGRAGGTGGLDALRQLASGKGLEGLHLVDVPGGEGHGQHVQAAHTPQETTASSSAYHLQPLSGKERIVSLTPSIHGAPPGDSTPRNSSFPTHHSNHSVSTIGPDGAHVYVWPPTPDGSVASHGPPFAGAQSVGGGLNVRNTGGAQRAEADAASIHEWEAVSDEEDEDSDEEAEKAAQAISGPVSVSDALRGGHQASSTGHPAGRQPPPPPPSSRYGDPNSALPPGSQIGRTRAAAIAAADGRESIVSDLDVETLRLDGGSSRRDSSSTIGSNATDSRMSVGTVRYDDDGSGRDWYAQQQRPLSSATRPVSVDSTPMARPEQRRGMGSHPPQRGGPHFTPPTRSATMPSPTIDANDTPTAVNTPQRRQQAPPSYPGHPALGSRPPPPLHAKSSTGTPVRPPLASQQQQASARSASSATTTTMSSFKTASSGHTHTASTPSSKPSRRTGTVGQDTKTGPSTAEHFLTQGIAYHEQGDLSRSAYYFERSAKVDGGCVVGMCMWGMTLREGWGARKDPRKGFEWIQRAAAKAGDLMKEAGVAQRTEAELKAVRSELKLSVYELGKCFCYGWGVKQDKPMALEYFELAAKLGDADAQAEAGALYASGKGGCKKDLKKAAGYYRMAAKQGYDLIGLSWVWKSKFD
ncbi:hypothetical protein BDZ90DRAFT_154393 [Jaminaea rosea]|uniref:HCP-like protein n=1 Tax=Jaminaea rosea TaxID=1569628 RepID=A0A316UTS4_9BASI|nr:hypothetical protein BDZ90DRAFT_154393 [Jaminaea rosea]PWN28662.1 hypothetical protein BDZ90DRAFT_154393 [Jaminaea rosea]